LNILNQTEVGLEAKKYMDHGELVPDSVVTSLLQNDIKSVNHKSLLFDGYPRTINQAISLGKIVKIDVVIALVIPHDVIIDRMSKRWIHPGSGRTYAYDYNPPKTLGLDDLTQEKLVQRVDDKPEVVLKRLLHYEESTLPILKYYGGLNDGTKVKKFYGKESNAIYKDLKQFFIDEINP
jgi:adenylate kinase family enzyme